MLLLSTFSSSQLFLSLFFVLSYSFWTSRLYYFTSLHFTVLFRNVGQCQTILMVYVFEQHCADGVSGRAMNIIREQCYEASNHNFEDDDNFITSRLDVKCHIEPKCGGIPSFVCRGAWGRKMVIWVEKVCDKCKDDRLDFSGLPQSPQLPVTPTPLIAGL